MPVAPRFHSGCQVQVSWDGSAGASNQPLGVSRSTRPSPLTSPEPTPWPAAWVPKSCFLMLESFAVGLLGDLVPGDGVDRVGQDVGDAVAGQVDGHGRLARARDVDLVVGPRVPPVLPGFSTQPTFLPKYDDGDVIGVAVAVDVEREVAKSL